MKTGEDEVCRGEAFAWVVRLQRGSATTADLDEFRRWTRQSRANAQAFAEARRLWTELGTAGHNVYARSPAQVRPGGVPIGRRALLGGSMAAAAAAAYAMVSPPMHLWPSITELLQADYRTATGEQRQLTLAEHVAIEMNTQTSIAVRTEADDVTRIELITGEGTMNSGARTLEVIAADGQARGTHAIFCVRRDDGRVRVTCLEGVVEVTWRQAARSLQARQQIAYSNDGLGTVASVDPEVVTAWRRGFLLFQDTPLVEAVAEINRYRRGRIVLMNAALGQRLINARMRIDQIDEIVAKLSTAFGASVTSLPGGLVVLS